MNINSVALTTTPTTDLAVLLRPYGWVATEITDDRAVVEASGGEATIVLERVRTGEASYTATVWWPWTRPNMLIPAEALARDAVQGWFVPHGGLVAPSPVIDAHVDFDHERELFYADLVIQGEPPVRWLARWARVLGGYLGAQVSEATS